METLLHPTAYGWSKGEFLAETLLGPAGYLRNCDREHQTGTYHCLKTASVVIGQLSLLATLVFGCGQDRRLVGTGTERGRNPPKSKSKTIRRNVNFRIGLLR